MTTTPQTQAFDSGVDFTLRELADQLDVKEWSRGDGTGSFHSDLSISLLNILAAGGLYDAATGRFATLQPAPTPARERLRLARGFVAYCLHVPLHWASFALLPWAGDWTYRRERREALADDFDF